MTDVTSDPLAPFLGRSVMIRTVTYFHTGRLTAASDDWLALEDAAWVADTGRWAEALATGSLREVEPFEPGTVLVNRGSVIDLCEWQHPLPREVR